MSSSTNDLKTGVLAKPRRRLGIRAVRAVLAVQAGRRWPGHARQGSVSLEFGLIGSAFFLLILGSMQLGLYFFTLHAVRSVTDMAARAAMTSNALTCSASYAYSNSSPPMPLAASSLTVTSSVICPASSTDGKTHITITTTYPFSFFLNAFSGVGSTISDSTKVVF